MRDDYPRFQEAGGAVVLVSMGSADQVASFRGQFRLPYPCLADPERRAYQAFGLLRGGIGAVAGPKMWRQGLKSLWQHGVGKVIGDPYQLGGSFVIDRAGIVRYAQRSATSADTPSNDELIAALGRAVGRIPELPLDGTVGRLPQ